MKLLWALLKFGGRIYAVCGLLYGCSSVSGTWYDYYLMAEKSANQGNWNEAIALLQQAIDREPTSERNKRAYSTRYIDYYPYLKLGHAYLATGEINEAKFYCEKEQTLAVEVEHNEQKRMREPLQQELQDCLSLKFKGENFIKDLPRLLRERKAVLNSESWAVLIGIENYSKTTNGFDPLPYAVRDAEAMKDYLINYLNFSENRIFSFFNEEATKSTLEDFLKSELPDKLSEEDRLLFYFSGHGETETVSSGKQYGYLIPIDGNKEKLSLTSISMEQISEYSQRIPAKQAIFIIDSCYSGIAGIIDKSGEGELKTVSKAQTVLFMASRGRQIMTAGASREKARMGEQWDEHSVYTYYWSWAKSVDQAACA